MSELDTAKSPVQTSLMRDKEIYRVLGKQIAARRRELQMTQSELGVELRMSRASVANIESGRQNVLLHHLYGFADALKVSAVADLLPSPKQIYVEDELLGVAFSGATISDANKAVMSGLVSRALSQRKVKL